MNKVMFIANHLNIDIQQEKYGICHFKKAYEIKSSILVSKLKHTHYYRNVLC